MTNKISYITYATGQKYLSVANNIIENYKKFFDDTILYGINDIDKNFYDKNKKIFESSRGAGYWLWKPYFILKVLEEINENDIVFYLDLGDELRYDIKNFVVDNCNNNDGFFLVEGYHNHSVWTKNDCFVLMNCNESRYFNATQLEAGCCAFVKNEKTINFVKEWLELCQRYDIISDESETKNSNNFKEHRYDQSILTNLAIKHNLKTVSIHQVSKYISYNKFF